MKKLIDRNLVHWSLLRVLEQYQNLSIAKQKQRPIRGWRPGDEDAIIYCISSLRNMWYEKKRDESDFHNMNIKHSSAVFNSVKEKFFDDQAVAQEWSKETRNLYSSTTATYIGLDKKPLNKDRVDALRKLERKFNMFLYPNKMV